MDPRQRRLKGPDGISGFTGNVVSVGVSFALLQPNTRGS